MSGPDALAIASRHFRGKRNLPSLPSLPGLPSLEDTPSHHIRYGRFLDGARAPIDTVLVSVFRAPHSYTGEDVVEISSHGGSAIPDAIFATLIGAGARPARPGEFTERAYRNGKLDLAQAEAVAALIRARSDRAARAAGAALGGSVSRRLERLDEALVALLAEVEARIDFPSEAGEGLDGAALAKRCEGIAGEIGSWLAAMPSARRRDAGVSVVLAGPPNVGKSSLLNALVGFERAIVSDAPGTTRDTVESSLWLDGVELRLIDTAGIRTSLDPIERMGNERAAMALEQSDLAVVVLDRSQPAASLEAFGGARRGGSALAGGAPVLVAWNKADLARAGVRDADWSATPLAGTRVLAEVETVAIQPAGADPLRRALRDALPAVLDTHSGEEFPTANARHQALLTEAHGALSRAAAALRADDSCDVIATDLAEARRVLGEIVGRGVDQEVVAAIFSRFCIGK